MAQSHDLPPYIIVLEAVSAKYTRSRVRKSIPEDMVYILDELLNVTDDVDKDFYYDEIINTILDTGIAESFIASLCRTIQALSIDMLHIIGDIYDRGPRADIIMDELMKFHDIDIQWGNHDISWMGATSGNQALIANVIRISMRYNNFDILEDGYWLNLRALAVFAAETYKDDDCALFMPSTLDDNIYDPVDTKFVAKMHKAITVIQLKLEGQLMEKYPEWEMRDRVAFKHVNFADGTVDIGGKTYRLKDISFPTVDPADPLELSDGKKELMSVLSATFRHSEKLHRHIRFLYTHSLNLAEHYPFIPGESEHTPNVHLVERLDRRANISDTDKVRDILEQINDLRELLDMYRSGEIKESQRRIKD